MSPSALTLEYEQFENDGDAVDHDCLLGGALHAPPLEVNTSKGNYLILTDGRRIFDAAGGAAVNSLGYGNKEVVAAVSEQLATIPYVNPQRFTTPTTIALAEEMIMGTGLSKRKGQGLYHMARVFLLNSGSDATDAVVKLGRQYFLDLSPSQEQRTKFIAREISYHGNTLGALSLSSHLERRRRYEPLLRHNVSWVSSCNAYRQRLPLETDECFVARKALELDAEFRHQGPETVIGFVCEPISGAAQGCTPYVPGYLAAMKSVCKKYGALFILDEVMCGMGRTGTMHAWQAEHCDDDPAMDCVPDLQMVGKGLGSGYQAVSAVFVGHSVVNTLKSGIGYLAQGHTYQSHPSDAAAALAVLRIIRRDDLLSNVRVQGAYLSSLLQQHLGSHPNVGNIRGIGLFWGVEFVSNKVKKTPFGAELRIATRIIDRALEAPHNITFYAGQGTENGLNGDHVMIAPAYTTTREEVEFIVRKLITVVNEVFVELHAELAGSGINGST